MVNGSEVQRLQISPKTGIASITLSGEHPQVQSITKLWPSCGPGNYPGP